MVRNECALSDAEGGLVVPVGADGGSGVSISMITASMPSTAWSSIDNAAETAAVFTSETSLAISSTLVPAESYLIS